MAAETEVSQRAFRVAYDGSAYHGFQRQPDVETVEGTLLSSLAELELIDEATTPPAGYSAAGRTDAGVSALAQTVTFRAPRWLRPAVFNGVLPPDIRIWSVAEVSDDFHATHDATARTYEYYLHVESASVAVDRLALAMDRLAGAHDFHNLTPDATGTERTLRTEVCEEAPFAILTFSADGFPRQLVRRAVSLATAVATGERPLDDIERLLSGPPVDGPDGVAPASVHPLVLVDVAYPALDFQTDQEAVDDVVEVFEGQRLRLETRARLAERILDGIAPDR